MLIGAGATAGAALVNYSGLASATAAEHLLVAESAIHQAPTAPASAGAWRTSRNSDAQAYDRDRVARRLTKVIIAGREYDAFDDTLLDRLDDLLKLPLPDIDDEMARQDEKLSRFFEVKTDTNIIKVPLFKPVIAAIPKFSEATDEDFSAYAQMANDAIREERKRIMLLLLNVELL